MDSAHITQLLNDHGLIDSTEVTLEPMQGGVSSDIWLVQAGSQQFVIKQALPQLKVAATWKADVNRNLTEQAFIHYLSKLHSNAVPKLLISDPETPCFVMEYLDSPFQNWKSQLLAGQFDLHTTQRAADLLALIHADSRNRPELASQFDTGHNFLQLRIEPYLLTTGQRHPALQGLFEAEAERLLNHREALVHGDFSPKNMLISPDRLVLLDHEVAWYGDPAFDLAFFLNHLFLKCLLHFHRNLALPDLPLIAWRRYFSKGILADREALAVRTSRLLLMLMLARVDGKSPVEYLNESQHEGIRAFVHQQLTGPQAGDFSYLHANWKQAWT